MAKGPKIILAVAVGLLAAMFGMLYLSSERDRLLGTSEVVRVYVANKDIPAGVPIDESAIGEMEVPRRYVQPQSIAASEVPKSKIIGLTIAPIKEGEQITRTKLSEGATRPLSSDLSSRKNLVAVAVAMQGLPHSVHGLVRAGDRVDVLASFQFKTTDDQFTEVRPLFQNLEVIAVNDRTASSPPLPPDEKGADAPDRAARTVTLAANPAQAQQLVLAQQLGSVWLLLRGSGDTNPHEYEIWNNQRLLQSPYKLLHSDSQEELMRQLAKR